MDAMKYNDLRDFLTLLEQQGELKRITWTLSRLKTFLTALKTFTKASTTILLS